MSMMSAHEQMKQMLDQLMGTGRDGENNRYKVKFTDPRVCKSFLLGCCPHDILASTRMDLGDCPKIHDLALRADYEQASAFKDYYYDIDAMEHLQAFINDCDRRTELAKRRLAETQEELSAEVAAKANKVHELAEQIGKKLAKAEQLGADGSVEESLKLMEEVEEVKKKKAQAELDYRNSMPASSYQQQKLRVCEVCSAYLGIHDNDRRLADHFGGKLHLGFIKIREKLEELKKSVNERREKQRVERDKEKERDDKKLRERSRDRDSKDRVRRRSKSRSRSRSRNRRSRRSRSRSRERRRRSRSPDLKSHSRKSRSNSRSRRSRSRSVSKRSRSSRRSRSKERRRSRESSRDRKRDRSRSQDRRSKQQEDKDDKSPKDKER